MSEVVLDARAVAECAKAETVLLIGCIGEQDGFLDAIFSTSRSSREMTVAEGSAGETLAEYYYRRPQRLHGAGAEFSASMSQKPNDTGSKPPDT